MMSPRDVAEIDRPLQVGVIGLGERWRRRYAPALQRSKAFQVGSVCDQVYGRADQEARAWQCKLAAGPAEMFEDDRLDAVLLLDDQWYGYWPVELACRSAKPLFCAAPPGPRDDRLADVCRQANGRSPVMIGLAPRLAPATVRLRKLLDRSLGTVRSIVCHCPGWPRPGLADAAVWSAVDWCLSLIPERPSGVRASATAIELAFSGERAAHIILSGGGRPGLLGELVAEHGTVRVTFPSRLEWTSRGGRHVHQLPCRRSTAGRFLERFYQAVRQGRGLTPGLEEACRAWLCLQAAQRNLAQGQEVPADQW